MTRAAIVASAVVLGGCPRTVTAPATELPNLSPANMARDYNWPEITTTRGERETLSGAIDDIHITHNRQTERVSNQFDATVKGNDLIVTNWQGPRTYSLAERPTITIDYTDRKAGFVTGGIFIVGAGLPLAILGISFLVEASEINEQGSNFPGLATGLTALTGVAILFTGGAAIAGGIVLATRTPKKPTQPSWATVIRTLRVGPTGAGLSIKF